MKINFNCIDSNDDFLDGRVTFYTKINRSQRTKYQAISGGYIESTNLEDFLKNPLFDFFQIDTHKKIFCVGFQTNHEKKILDLPGYTYVSNVEFQINSDDEARELYYFLGLHFLNYMNSYFIKTGKDPISPDVPNVNNSIDEMMDGHYDIYLDDEYDEYDEYDEFGGEDFYEEDDGISIEEPSKYSDPIPEPTEENMKDIWENT